MPARRYFPYAADDMLTLTFASKVHSGSTGWTGTNSEKAVAGHLLLPLLSAQF